MEIEIHRSELESLIGALALALVVVLGLIGWRVTPVEDGRPRVLTREDWQALKARRAFREELDRLRREAESLSDLLDARPDPVRAGLALDRARQLAAGGHPALAAQREALLAAAEAVNAWAAGAADYAEARAALQGAVETLGRVVEP